MIKDYFKNRIRFISVVVFFVGALFCVKLFWLQVVHGEMYSKEANRQYITPQGSQFDRGSIFFKKKNGELVSGASLLHGFTVAINPKLIENPEQAFADLSILIPLDQETFSRQVAKKDDPYEEIATRVTEEQAEKITALSLTGVTLYRVNTRFSPSGFLAPQVIGFVSFKEKDLIGRYGLERSYNEVLSRKSGRLYVNFFAEVFTQIIPKTKQEAVTEGDIITSIEPLVQASLQNELDAMRERWDSDRTTGIVMDPKTGKIVAMAVSPHFDINNFRDEKDISVFNNLNVEGVFEMGSIVKPLIAAIALDQQVITADTRYNDTGSVQVRNRTIRNFDRKGRGNGVTMQQVLNESLNTGMVFIMQQMKPNLFVEQFSKFRFDQKTGIDLPGEIGGITGNLQTARDVELANISFGQGIAVTPIGMIRAFSALANRGQLVEPHVVDSIEYLDESIKTIEPKIIDSVISPATSEEITRMLVNVFDNYFSGTKKILHYSVAGKTGTAQIANSETGGYYDDRNLHTFVGYFPAYDPQFIIFMMNEHPKQGARFSSQTLIDPFLNLTKFLINYYNIPPDR